MGYEWTMTWQDIRALRATPTGLAANQRDRKRIFAAALQQAEELAEAAKAVSYAARPLLAFYSLSQAGRAIAAAHLSRKAALMGHGLSFDLNDSNAVLQATVSPPGDPASRGAFQDVATAIGFPALAGPAQLGQLWAANPDLRDIPTPGHSNDWLPCLDSPLGTRTLLMTSAGPPDPRTIRTTTGGMVSIALDVPGETAAEVIEGVNNYPTLAGTFPLSQEDNGTRVPAPTDFIGRTPGPDGVMRVMLAKASSPEMSLAEYWKLQDSMLSVVEIDDRYPLRPHPNVMGFAQPAVAGAPSPSPLMLWWALLLGLSSLARYHPAAWTRAVDVDSSVLAVPLQQVLDMAAERVPARILTSLRG